LVSFYVVCCIHRRVSQPELSGLYGRVLDFSKMSIQQSF
jgi:hypothetical protein